jgi:hypothetical protein
MMHIVHTTEIMCFTCKQASEQAVTSIAPDSFPLQQL